MHSNNLKERLESILGFKIVRRNYTYPQGLIRDDYVWSNFNKLSPVQVSKLRSTVSFVTSDIDTEDLKIVNLFNAYLLLRHDRNSKDARRLFFLNINADKNNVCEWLEITRTLKPKARTLFVDNINYFISYCIRNKKNIDESLFLVLLKNISGNIKSLDSHNQFVSLLSDNTEGINIRTPENFNGKTLLFINPPVNEPFIFLKKKILGKINHISKSFVYSLPIGLLRIAKKKYEQGYRICFMDCFASLPKIMINSKKRISVINSKVCYETKDYVCKRFWLGMKEKDIEKVIRKIKNIHEIYVGCTFTYHNDPAHRVISICKKLMPDVKLIFGGIYPTLAPDDAKKSGADEIFRGQVPDTDNFSLDYELLGYNPGFCLIKGTKGCPNNCAYCAVHVLEGRLFCHKNPCNVFAEIKEAHDLYGLTEIGLWDSNILVKYHNYFGQILKKLKNYNFYLSAPEGFDYRLMTLEIAYNLKKAGFVKIDLALENVDSEYSKNTLQRDNNIVKLKNAVYNLRKAGFVRHNIRLFIITGLPGQTIDSIIKNIRFAWSLGCNVIIFPFTPIPGTKMYADNLMAIGNKPLEALHPFLFAFVSDEKKLGKLIDISCLNIINNLNLSQKKYAKKLLKNDILDQI